MQIDQAVQPGMPFLFPWLNTIARNFESYRVLKLVFFFKSTSADAVLSTAAPSGSTSLGSVIMLAQYNVLAAPPQNKREMLNNATAVSCKPSNSMAFSVIPRSSYRTLFVRTPYTPMGGDRRLYDHCDFHLATEGMQATTGSIGELSVMAVMQFTKPTLQNEVDPLDMFSWSQDVVIAAGGNALGALQFTNVLPTATLLPLPGSTIGGYIGRDPNDGSYTYYFGDSVDEQIGAIFRWDWEGKIISDNITTAFHVVFRNSPQRIGDVGTLGPSTWKFTNCEPISFNGLFGRTYGESPVLPSTMTNNRIQPAEPAPANTYDGGFMTYFYIKITGPDASIGLAPKQNALNVVDFRAFDAATGNPLGALTGTYAFQRRLTVSRVSFGE